MGQFNNEIALYRRALSKKIQAAVWNSVPIWSQLQGFVYGKEGAYPRTVPTGKIAKQTLRPTYKPVEVWTDLQHEGGWEMDMVVHYPLTEKPLYGDRPALGTGESKKFAYYQALINEVVKVVKVKDGLMGEQAVKNKTNILQIIKNSKEDLQDYFLRWTAHAHWDALFRGFSDNILDTKRGGFGAIYPQRSHPNYYVAGQGKVSFDNDPHAYEVNIYNALQNLTPNDKLTVAKLEAMVAEAPNLKIRRAVMGPNGDSFYIIIIDNIGAFQLMQDPDWKEIQMNAAARGEEVNKLFSGRVEGYMAGAYIIVDETMPGVTPVVDGSNNLQYLQYHNDNPLENPVDTATYRHAVLLGASAIAVAHALPVQFKSETWEFDRQKEDAGIFIAGWNRVDIYDQDGYFGAKGDFKENVSSMVLAFHGSSIEF